MKKLSYLVLATLLTIILGVAVLIVNVKSQQAETFPPVNGNNFYITASDNNTCPTNNVINLASYGGSFTVTNKYSSSQTIHVIIHRFFCSGIVSDCEQNDKSIDNGNVTFQGNETKTFTVPAYSGNLACGQTGTYQADIEFVGFNNYRFQSAIWCHAQTACLPPTPTNTPTPTTTVPPTPTVTVAPTCIPVPPCVYATPFNCEIAINQGYCPILTPTPTNIPTPTPTIPVTPSPTQTQNCGNNENNNCNNNQNNNNNSQSQNQTQNNNQNVNVDLTSYNPNATPTPQTIVYNSSNTESLPNTGTPWEDLATIGLAPVGYLLKRKLKA